MLTLLGLLCLGFGLGMEPISKWGPWMDLVSIYIIPIGATLGAVSWFYVMKKDELRDAVNTCLLYTAEGKASRHRPRHDRG